MKYLTLTKPGIIFGNIVTLTGGFFLATQSDISISLLFISIIGMSLIIAGGCVFNNCIDQDIDGMMARTKMRPLITGSISIKAALIYGTLLTVLGFFVIYFGTNLLTTIIAFVGFIFYVVVYSLFLKRKSTYGTIIGGVAGAVPPVVGYCAVTNQVDIGAILLFIILFTWQIPHFYAISIYRLEDFKTAGIPILPVQKSLYYTKVSMIVYIIAFSIAAVMPILFGYVGLIYFIVATILSFIWLAMGIQGLIKQVNDRIWAKKMFLYSVLMITILCLMMAVKI
ncbi:MAG: protoheme IX farnesyltransferase [Legionellales bacterium]|nr:protoheme IX farnesyltransferase [Legionellales bacterium]